MRWVFMGLALAVSAFAWGEPTGGNQAKVKQIDSQIEELKEMKRGYESRAIRAENQADRLQFEQQFTLETRRFYELAEENRVKAQKVQDEIDKLEAEKARLLKGK